MDRIEVAAAVGWCLVAVASLSNAGIGLLPGFVLLVVGATSAVVWVVRSLLLLARRRGTSRDRTRRARWYALPIAFAAVAVLVHLGISPLLLAIRLELSESALRRETLVTYGDRYVRMEYPSRFIGLFWVWTVIKDERCTSFITVESLGSRSGLKICRTGGPEPPVPSRGYSTQSLYGGWFSWRAEGG